MVSQGQFDGKSAWYGCMSSRAWHINAIDLAIDKWRGSYNAPINIMPQGTPLGHMRGICGAMEGYLLTDPTPWVGLFV